MAEDRSSQSRRSVGLESPRAGSPRSETSASPDHWADASAKAAEPCHDPCVDRARRRALAVDVRGSLIYYTLRDAGASYCPLCSESQGAATYYDHRSEER